MTGEPRCAVGVPNVGPFGDPLLLVELAVAAEEHGWDGFFVWDHLLYHDQRWDVADPLAVIAAVAARTARIRIGVLVNVLARRRIGEVARESVTVDLLSGGRLGGGAGLGSLAAEFTAFGEVGDARERAAGQGGITAAAPNRGRPLRRDPGGTYRRCGARPGRRAGSPVPGGRADLVDRSAGLVARQPAGHDEPGPPGAAGAGPPPALIPLTTARRGASHPLPEEPASTAVRPALRVPADLGAGAC